MKIIISVYSLNLTDCKSKSKSGFSENSCFYSLIKQEFPKKGIS